MDIGSDSNSLKQMGLLLFIFWIKAKGTNLSQGLGKPAFRGLWRFIVKKDMETWNAGP